MSRTRALVTIVGSGPFDTTTPEGRANERYRRAALTVLATGAARAVGIAATFVSIPLVVRYVGQEQYGVWVTISAITAMLAFADFGLGNGLLTAISASHGADDPKLTLRYVSSAFFMLTAVAVALGLAFAVVYPLVSWPGLFNVSSPAAAEQVGPSLAVFIGCFLVSIPLGIVQRIQFGYQEGFATGVWVAVGSLIGLAGLIVGIGLGASLPWLVLAMAGGPVLGLLLNWVVLFGRRRPELRPRLRSADRSIAVRLMRVGFLFFVLQLAIAIAYQSDLVVATRVIGPDAAAQYAVTYRLFMLAPALISLALMPLWPAYTEAIERRDSGWVKRTVVGSMVASFGTSAAVTAVLLVFAQPILAAWVGSSIEVPRLLVIGMGIWAVLSSGFNALAMLFNGAVVMRFQVVVALVMAAASVLASIVLASRFGVAGIIWGTVAAYVLCSAVPQLLYLPRLLKRIERPGSLVHSLAADA